MPRIQPVTLESADADQTDVLQTAKKKMGKVPNIIATMANSPAVANAYLGFSQALAGGSLSPQLREQIALTVGQTNGCDYCVSAHAALGARAGLSDDDVAAARRADADDEKNRAALAFAKKLVDERGYVSDGDVEALRSAGFSDGEVAEIVAAVALNIFTNYFNHVAETEVDFPAVPELAEA